MSGHYFFVDEEGNDLVLEPDAPGHVTVYNKTNGIMTNSPNYAYHLQNLQSFANIVQVDSYRTPVLKDVNGNPVQSHGASGGFGLPGDTSPNSRFIKASYLRDTTTRKDLITAEDGVLRMFRILNNFDIVPGMSLKQLGSGAGEGGTGKYANPIDVENVAAGHTDHTEVKDLKNKKYYYKTCKNQTVRCASFDDYDLDGTQLKTINMENDESMKFEKVILK